MADARNILAIIEPDIHPHEVCERAAWLARMSGCSVELLLCDSEVSALHRGWLLSAEAKEAAAKISTAQKELIDDLAENIRDTDIPVVTDVLDERPIADAILERVADSRPRYVVKGTQHHSAAQRSIIAHTDWQLIRSCAAPLYLAKPAAMSDNPLVVAAVDPTHEHDKPAALDDIIVQAAKDLTQSSGGELQLLHTYARLAGSWC